MVNKISINEKRKSMKIANMALVKTITETHHSWKLHKIRQCLKEDYGVKLTTDTISRYRKELMKITKQERKEKRAVERTKRILQERVEKPAKIPLAKLQKFPMVITDPTGKTHSIQSEITSISLYWKRDGYKNHLTFGPISQNLGFWHWDDGLQYGKKDTRRQIGWAPMVNNLLLF